MKLIINYRKCIYCQWYVTGKNCEVYVNECASNPCQYGSTCVERQDLVFNYQSNKTNVSLQFHQELNNTLTTNNTK